MSEAKISPAQRRRLHPQTINSFMCLMADILRLPDETLAFSFLYYNKYKRFNDPLAETSALLDAHTLALTSLTLATKTTTTPRRLRSILLPAYHLLHPPHAPSKLPPEHPKYRPDYIPLTIPSPLYDSLRATLVRAELIHLRVLKFELRPSLAFEHLPRYLDRAIGPGGWETGVAEDYELWDRERKEEDGVVGLMDTAVGRSARVKIVAAYKNYKIANFYPARAIAATCVRMAFPPDVDRGDFEAWLEYVTGGKVDRDDCGEIMDHFEGYGGCPTLDSVKKPKLRLPGQELPPPSEMGYRPATLSSNNPGRNDVVIISKTPMQA